MTKLVALRKPDLITGTSAKIWAKALREQTMFPPDDLH